MQADLSTLSAEIISQPPLPPFLHSLHASRESQPVAMSARRVLQLDHLMQSLETTEIAVLSLDGEGALLQATRRARDLIAEKDGLEVRSGHLKATLYREQQQLGAILREALPGASQSLLSWQGDDSRFQKAREGAMLVTRSEGKRSLQVIVTPVNADESGGTPHCSVLVYLCDPEAVPASRSSLLRKLYGLSPTECRLADRLAAGSELRDAAATLKLTVQTARFHLKAIFRKTGTNRQAGLVRLVLGLPGALA
jgi:DNA-binding CsgD family transcriptional regulator